MQIYSYLTTATLRIMPLHRRFIILSLCATMALPWILRQLIPQTAHVRSVALRGYMHVHPTPEFLARASVFLDRTWLGYLLS